MPRDIEELVRQADLTGFRYREVVTEERQHEAAPRWPMLLATDRVYRMRLGTPTQRATMVEHPAAELWEGGE